MTRNQHTGDTIATTSSLGKGEAVLAFDVGGTDLKAGLINRTGNLLEVVRVSTPASTPGTADAIFDEIVRLARAFHSRYPDVDPQAAGLLVPGYVDEESGTGVFAENFGWRDVPFRDHLSALLRIPVSVGHDVRGAGEAEHRLGAAAPFDNVVVMAIGTGIASAIFVKGSVYSGTGLAGEMGHSKVADGPLCACGGYGCLEAVASAAAIGKRYNARAGAHVRGSIDVLQLVHDGDENAIFVWESALDALALDLSHTVALLSPEAIIIGGGLASAGDDLFVPLRRKLDAILTFQHRPLLLPASLGENAGIIGAALKARDLLKSAV